MLDEPQSPGVLTGPPTPTVKLDPDHAVERSRVLGDPYDRYIRTAGGTEYVGNGAIAPTLAGGAVDLSTAFPWLVNIWPAVASPVFTVGTWTKTQNVNIGYGMLISPGTINAEAGWDILLGAGTWTIEVLQIVGTNLGIGTWSLDDVAVGTTDFYAAGGVANTFVSIVDIVVATSSKKRLKIKMASKNASSSNYFAQLQHIQLRRTA